MDYGDLRVNVISEADSRPIEGATVRVVSQNEPEQIIEEARTNEQGKIEGIELEAPPLEYSMEPF